MRLLIAAVGQRQPAWADTAYEDFAKRFPAEMRLELKAVKAEPRSGGRTAAQMMSAEALRLEAGEHTIRYEYAGDEGTGNPGISKVDAFYLQPLVGRREYLLPDGTQLTLTYNTLTGDSDLLETTP